MKYKLSLIALATSAVLSGCNSDDENSVKVSVPSSPEQSSITQPPTPPEKEAIAYPDGHDPEPYYFISDLEGWTGIKARSEISPQNGWDGFGKALFEPANYYGKLYRNFEQFDKALEDFDSDQYSDLILGASIRELQAAMDNGDLTAVELTKFYLFRIGQYDIDKLNSVLELNPDAIAIAKYADQVRASGKPHSEMLGIPVLVKDNIATNDRMHTTGGMAALLDWNPDHDAHIIKRLRESGAVILGKANLSENANYFSVIDPNGFTNLGGQTRNAYGFYSVLGSSSGSGVAAAAQFAAITVGTETQGSINAPAEMSSVVGFKPSIGLVSRDNIIPLAASQDSAGPMARSVEDVAIEMNILADADPSDPLYSEVRDHDIPDYTKYLDPSVYQGIKVGIYENSYSSLEQSAWLEDIKAALGKAGVSYEVVNDLPSARTYRLNLGCEFNYEFADMAKAQHMPVKSVADLLNYNNVYPERRAVWGQKDIQNSVNTNVDRDTCLNNAEEKRKMWDTAVNDYFENHDFQVLVTETSKSAIYAPAGAPSASVPFGYETADAAIQSDWRRWARQAPTMLGTPVSTHVMAPRFEDGNVLAISKAIEVGRKSIARRQHKAPDLDATIKMNEDAGVFAIHDEQRAESPTYVPKES
ncbi:amidase family protein [Vibrio artabrorum]|uniref:Amidase family protein n=2 Tax=Vibrio artabrorum TaxID=446374 RepID=A0ABT8CJB3_9VIBR|nr:amidase family protein [Vibrio artabrorum]MDN3701826.1 amidase family protein [Vibrio artabrorum]